MYYARGVADVTPEFIRGCGCDALLLDIDNTVSHVDAPEATAEAETWLQTLREAELPVAFVSNNDPERVEPFAQRYGAKFVSHAQKPRREGYDRAAAALGRAAALLGGGRPALYRHPRRPQRRHEDGDRLSPV